MLGDAEVNETDLVCVLTQLTALISAGEHTHMKNSWCCYGLRGKEGRFIECICNSIPHIEMVFISVKLKERTIITAICTYHCDLRTLPSALHFLIHLILIRMKWIQLLFSF